MTNTTISSNNGGSNGGGIFTSAGQADSTSVITLTNVTLAHNEADSGNSIFAGYNGGTGDTLGISIVTLKNSLVAGSIPDDNCATTPGSTFVSNGYNLDSGTSCGFPASGDITGTDPLLGPLQDNGGATETQAFLPGSPAIDAGSPDCPPPVTDQRGVTRPVGLACDIGAYEAPLAPTLSISKTGPATATAGAPVTYTLTVTNHGDGPAANLVITDAIPAGAHYVSGGTRAGEVVSWTVSSLAASGGVTQTTFVVTTTETITNRLYGVRADGGIGPPAASRW